MENRVNLTEDENDTTEVVATAQSPDFSALTLFAVSSGNRGTATISGGQVIYTPEANYSGKDTLVYCIHDGENDTTVAYLCYNIIPVNDAPVAVNDTLSTLEDEAFVLDILANNYDAEDSAVVDFTIRTQTQLGTLTVDSLGVSYTPQENIWGLDSFTYEVRDAQFKMSETATVFIQIDSVNEAPLPGHLSVNLTEDESDSSNVVILAGSPDFSALTLVDVINSNNGRAFIAGDSIIYIPKADFNGLDTIRYAIADAENDTVWASVYYTVLPVNDAPMAYNDSLSTLEDMVLHISPLSNDKDAEDLVLNDFTITSDPQLGTLNTDSLEFIYTPQANVWGVDTFRYFVRDAQGLKSNTATVVITINSVNEAPVLSTVRVNLTEDHKDTTNVMLKAQSPDKSALTLAGLSAPLYGSATFMGDSVFYTPARDFLGKDTLTYYVHDAENDTAQALLIYNVIPVNDAPVAVTDYAHTIEDSVVYIYPMVNDYDAEDVTVSKCHIVSQGTKGSCVVDSNAIIYTPEPNLWGLDSFTYTVEDAYEVISEPATVYITIDSVNEVPILKNISINITEDENDTIDVLSTAQSPDFSALTLFAVSSGNIGTATISGGQVIYTPEANYSGKDTLAYCIHDAENDTAVAYLCYNIIPVNDAPVAVNDTLSTLEDEAFVLDILANDYDAEDSTVIDYTILSQPKLGAISTDSLEVTYTPQENIWGCDSFTYVVFDMQRVMSQVATVYIRIDSVNEAPVLSDFKVNVTEEENDTCNVMLLAQSLDFSALTLVSVSQGSHGKARVNAHSVIYTPDHNFAGLDTVCYSVKDAENDTSSAFIFYNVSAENDAPVAHNDTLYTIEDQAFVFDVLSNDYDAEDCVVTDFTILTQTKRGLLSVDSLGFTYTPQANVWGVDTFTYFVHDAQGLKSNTATVVITIDSVNEAPLLKNFNINVTEDKSDTTEVLTSAQSPDFSDLTLFAVSQGNNGTAVVSDSQVIYTPAADFLGKDTLVYCVHDGENDTAVAYLYYNIIPVNDAPVALDDRFSTLEDKAFILDILCNDYDAEDGVIANFSILTQTKLGVLSVDSLGITYLPQENVWGVDSFTYCVTDCYNVPSNVAHVYITIDSVNEAPVVIDMEQNIFEDRGDTIDVLAAALSPDASPLHIAQYCDAAHGKVSICHEQIIYVPDSNYYGSDSISYTLVDGENDSASAMIRFNIAPVNDAPIAYDDEYKHIIENNEYDAIVLKVTENDYDADLEEPMGQVIIDVRPVSGQAVTGVDPLEIVYSPVPGFDGIDSLSYHLLDDFGAASPRAWVYLTIEQKNSGMLYAIDDTIVVYEDGIYDLNPIELDVMMKGDSVVMKKGGLTEKSTSLTKHIETLYGSFQIENDTLWHYSPDADFYGWDTTYYWVEELDGSFARSMMLIHVLPVNDAPVCDLLPQLNSCTQNDSLLSVSKGLWHDVDGDLSFTYTWYGERDSVLVQFENTSDTITLTEDMKVYNIWCELTASDDGYPLPGLQTIALSDTLASYYHKPEGLVASADTLCKSWHSGHLISTLDCAGNNDGHAHEFILNNYQDCFEIVGNKLYLDTTVLYIDIDVFDLDITITHPDMGGLNDEFELKLTVVNDLKPLMQKGYPFVAEVFGDSVTVKVMADKPAHVYFEVKTADGIIEKASELYNPEMTIIDQYQELLLCKGGLSSQEDYEMVVYLADTTEQSFTSVYALPFTTEDIIAPEFMQSTPYVLRTSEDSAIIVVAVDEAAKVRYQIWENDMTVSVLGDFVLDTAMVLDTAAFVAVEEQLYHIKIGGLKSQMEYLMLMYAEDTLLNANENLSLSFTTHDTVMPFFPGGRPHIRRIIDSRITYEVCSSEDAVLYSRLSQVGVVINDVEENQPLIYSNEMQVPENDELSIETEALNLDGEYRLDFMLEDSAGNRSIVHSVEFRYPELMGVGLKSALIHQGEQLEFTNVQMDADYVLYNMHGRILSAGSISKEAATVNVDHLFDGNFVVRVNNRWQDESFRFIKSTHTRP